MSWRFRRLLFSHQGNVHAASGYGRLGASSRAHVPVEGGSGYWDIYQDLTMIEESRRLTAHFGMFTTFCIRPRSQSYFNDTSESLLLTMVDVSIRLALQTNKPGKYPHGGRVTKALGHMCCFVGETLRAVVIG